jgi:hypothetical protein
MINRREARETRDAARKNQEETRSPEEPHARRLAGLAESNLKTQPPRPVRAAIGKRGTQFPDRRCAGAQRRRQQQNTAAPYSLIWLARV